MRDHLTRLGYLITVIGALAGIGFLLGRWT